MHNNLVVGSLKVESKTTVLGFHTGTIASADLSIVFHLGAVPRGIGEIPLGNVVGLGVTVPSFFNISCKIGLYGDGLVFFGWAHEIVFKNYSLIRFNWFDQLRVSRSISVECLGNCLLKVLRCASSKSSKLNPGETVQPSRVY